MGTFNVAPPLWTSGGQDGRDLGQGPRMQQASVQLDPYRRSRDRTRNALRLLWSLWPLRSPGRDVPGFAGVAAALGYAGRAGRDAGMPSSQGPQFAHHPARYSFEQRLSMLKRRLIQEATSAVAMLEGGLDALWRLDREAAREVRRRDDTIDREEVQIEQEVFQLLAMEQPVARDFRNLTFILKVNSDVERVADHAASVAKVAGLMRATTPPRWPTALTELGQRVPAMCHALLRAALDEDAEAARAVVAEDKLIDQIEKRLFEETLEMIRRDGGTMADGMLIYRVGRELERVADLMCNIAEDLIYLATGQIVRHAKRRGLEEMQPGSPGTPPA
jgi:phosphate transport system protein